MSTPATGTSVIRTDALQAQVRRSYLPAGLAVLNGLAENLRDSLILIDKGTDRLNQVWEIYNKKGETDEDIIIDVDVSELDEGDTEDFNPNAVLKTFADGDDVDRLAELADELRVISDELTANNGGVKPAFAEQIDIVIEAISDIDDVDALEYWQNDYAPDSSGDLTELAFDSDAETVPHGNQIRDAVSSAQAANEGARQELRKALFTWEEFVKSSGSIIDRITRIIEGMARGVKGQ